MNYKEFKNPVVAKSMKKARKAAEVNTLKWMSNVSEGLDSELKTLKRLSAQIAKGEIAFSEDYKDCPSAIKANMSLYASDLMRIAALLEFLIIELEAKSDILFIPLITLFILPIAVWDSSF